MKSFPDDHVDIYPGRKDHDVVYDSCSLDNDLDDLWNRLKLACEHRNFLMVESIVVDLRRKVYLKLGVHDELL